MPQLIPSLFLHRIVCYLYPTEASSNVFVATLQAILPILKH